MSSLRIALALAAKDLRVAWSYRLSFVFGHVAGFGSVLVFYFVSRVVGESKSFGSPEEYFRFVVVGMGVALFVERTVTATMGAARTDQVQGTLESVAALPVRASALGFGWLAFPITDALIGVGITFAMALPLGLWGIEPAPLTLLVAAVLSVAAFAGMGFLGTGIVIAFQQGAGVVPLGLAVMGLLSGTVFPIEVMPQWMQTLASLSPLTHALDALRAALLEGASLSEVGDSLLILAGFAAVLLPLGILALEWGLRHARRNGGLSRF